MTANDIGQILGPLLRQKWKHWADDIWDIGKILRTLDRKWGAFDRYMGHRADIVDIDQTYGTLGRNWEAWADIGVLHISHLA